MRKIVIGYDGSNSAQRALERAAEFVDGGSITVVSAVHRVAGKSGPAYDPIEQEDHLRHLKEARSRLAKLGIEAEVIEGHGDPARVIAEQASESQADLIVVGNEHKNLIERLVEGSVSAGVTRRAHCDVLVVA
jgi:nucleotide-binding universal stress UspA family protein